MRSPLRDRNMTHHTAAPPLFDPEGNHWHAHGTAITPLNHRGRPVTDGATVGVHSQYQQRFHARPMVVTTVMQATANVTLRMSPQDARATAKALLHAADVADATAAALALRCTTDQPRKVAA